MSRHDDGEGSEKQGGGSHENDDAQASIIDSRRAAHVVLAILASCTGRSNAAQCGKFVREQPWRANLVRLGGNSEPDDTTCYRRRIATTRRSATHTHTHMKTYTNVHSIRHIRDCEASSPPRIEIVRASSTISRCVAKRFLDIYDSDALDAQLLCAHSALFLLRSVAVYQVSRRNGSTH